MNSSNSIEPSCCAIKKNKQEKEREGERKEKKEIEITLNIINILFYILYFCECDGVW